MFLSILFLIKNNSIHKNRKHAILSMDRFNTYSDTPPPRKELRDTSRRGVDFSRESWASLQRMQAVWCPQVTPVKFAKKASLSF